MVAASKLLSLISVLSYFIWGQCIIYRKHTFSKNAWVFNLLLWILIVYMIFEFNFSFSFFIEFGECLSYRNKYFRKSSCCKKNTSEIMLMKLKLYGISRVVTVRRLNLAFLFGFVNRGQTKHGSWWGWVQLLFIFF